MFGMGMPEIILILAIALIVLGPKKLPEIAKSLGRGIAEFKKATQDFKQNIEVDNDFKEARDTLQDIKGDLEQGVRQSVSGGTGPIDVDRMEQKGTGEPDAGEGSEKAETPAGEEEIVTASLGQEPTPPESEETKEERKEKGSVQDA